MGILISDATLNSALKYLTRKELTRRRLYKQGVGTPDFELKCSIFEAELNFAQQMVSDSGKKNRAIVWDKGYRRFIIQDTQ